MLKHVFVLTGFMKLGPFWVRLTRKLLTWILTRIVHHLDQFLGNFDTCSGSKLTHNWFRPEESFLASLGILPRSAMFN